MTIDKRVICVSWNPALALTRQSLLNQVGLRVVSALGEAEGRDSCKEKADLMILGHSVPVAMKRALIQCFREHNTAPILSLLRPGQEKIPEATHGVEWTDPQAFLQTVKEILQ